MKLSCLLKKSFGNKLLISELISDYYNSKLIEQLADNISKIVKLTEIGLVVCWFEFIGFRFGARNQLMNSNYNSKQNKPAQLRNRASKSIWLQFNLISFIHSNWNSNPLLNWSWNSWLKFRLIESSHSASHYNANLLIIRNLNRAGRPSN